MLGYGSLPVWLAPAILLGVGVSLRRCLRSAPHRLVLIAVLAAPFSAAMVDIRITRVLAMMAPATILAVIGLDCLRHWLRRWVPTRVFATAVAAGLVAASTAMTADALRNGATWFDDYGMFGTQWGARQLYTELERVFDICHGCRRCVSLCDAYPTLFDLVDESSTFEVDGVAAQGAERVFLVDPLGYLMMYYAPGAEPKGMLKDLKKLLKYSRFG